MNQNELNKKVELHNKLLNGEPGGERFVLAGANLAGANLWDANLAGADLSGANLAGANLRGAVNILSIFPVGSRGDQLIGVKHKDNIMVKTGCFWGTIDEFEVAVKEAHCDGKHGRDYAIAIRLIKSFFEI